jgi:nucleoside-diphosphate-sugar epimerase
MPSWVLLGCGYTGTALVRMLPTEQVVAVRRDVAALDGLGVRAVAADLAGAAPLVDEGATVVWLVPPTAADAEVARAIAARGARRIVYVSSTGVYAPGGGARVDETWPLVENARRAAERAVQDAGVPVVVLRPAGIYGPGRGVAARLRAGTFRVVGDGSAYTSRVHVDDLAAAIALVAERGDGVYNVADDDPCPLAEHADTAAAMLGVPPPRRVPVDAVEPEVARMLLADRRVDASRLRALGWSPRYPSWRDALRLGAA